MSADPVTALQKGYELSLKYVEVLSSPPHQLGPGQPSCLQMIESTPTGASDGRTTTTNRVDARSDGSTCT